MINEKDKYTISEVAEKIGFKPHVIRFYEKEFNINIPRGENSRRYFTNNEINQLLQIKSLQEQGNSNKEIKDILKSGECTYPPSIDKEMALNKNKSISNDLVNVDSAYSANVDLKKDITVLLDKYNYRDEIEELKNKIDELMDKVNSIDPNKEDDILMCENARLKMKLKEKSYELAEINDKLKRMNTQKGSIFQRLFKRGIQI